MNGLARIVSAQAPVRVDLAGGWTDVAPYTHDFGGEVVNFAIAIHAHAKLEVDDAGKLDVHYGADARVGSGLGTTGAINVALMGAIGGADLSREAAVERAFGLEVLLGNRGGKQDQWAASHGGFNHLMFIGDKVEPLPFEILDSCRAWLHRQFLIVDTGIPHVSGDLHEGIWARYGAGETSVIEGLHTIRRAARTMAEGLGGDRRDKVVDALREVCRGVDALDPALHDPFREVVDPLLASRDVMAWKALGAGAGGCAGLLAGNRRMDAVRAAVEAAGWTILEWDYDDDGLVVNAN